MAKKSAPDRESPDEIATHIISILSQSAYTSFAQALREIIVNAHDALAERVDVRFSDDFTRLSIADDGLGMTSDEFRSRYARIANPATGDRVVKRGSLTRRKVGKFGIGHLAIAPVCRRARIVTSRGPGHPTMEFVLEYAEYLDRRNLEKPLSEVYQYYANSIGDRAIHETKWAAPSDSSRRGKFKSFTIVELEDIKPEIVTELKRPGLTLTDTFTTISDLSGFARLQWELGVILPVRYTEGGPVDGPKSTVAALARETEDNRFRVYLGTDEHAKPTELVRPIRLPAFSTRFRDTPRKGENFDVSEFDETLPGGARLRGYIVSQSSQVIPVELRGLLVRVRGVAIGTYRADFLGAKVVSSVFRDSTTGEIFVDDGFDEAITLDRTNFKEDAPALRELRTWLEGRLMSLRKKYWASGRQRLKARAKKKELSFDAKVSEKVSSVLSGPRAPREFKVTTRRPSHGRPCEIKPTTGEIRLDRDHKLFKGLKVQEKHILEICLYALEIARERGGSAAQPFYDETLKIISQLLGRQA